MKVSWVGNGVPNAPLRNGMDRGKENWLRKCPLWAGLPSNKGFLFWTRGVVLHGALGARPHNFSGVHLLSRAGIVLQTSILHSNYSEAQRTVGGRDFRGLGIILQACPRLTINWESLGQRAKRTPYSISKCPKLRQLLYRTIMVLQLPGRTAQNGVESSISPGTTTVLAYSIPRTSSSSR